MFRLQTLMFFLSFELLWYLDFWNSDVANEIILKENFVKEFV